MSDWSAVEVARAGRRGMDVDVVEAEDDETLDTTSFVVRPALGSVGCTVEVDPGIEVPPEESRRLARGRDGCPARGSAGIRIASGVISGGGDVSDVSETGCASAGWGSGRVGRIRARRLGVGSRRLTRLSYAFWALPNTP